MSPLLAAIERLPEGHCEGIFEGRRWGISKTTHAQGRSYKVYAEALHGGDFVSLNCYCTAQGEVLKPCEMPLEKVARFLLAVRVSPSPAA